MLRYVVTLAVLIVLVGFIASQLIDEPGETVIEWFGWKIEAQTSLIVASVIFVLWATIRFDRLLSFLIDMPMRFSNSMRNRREVQGRHALALGLIAVTAGDIREAERQTRRVKKLMHDDTLTALLAAQTAAMKGDTEAATQFFQSLADNPDTAFFGKLGLMRLAAESGNDQDALAMGREAFALNKNASSLTKALFTLEAKGGEWQAAIDALEVARKNKDISEKDAKRSLATLYYKLAQKEEIDGKPARKTFALLEKALKEDPGFVPAAIMVAEGIDKNGKKQKSINILKTCFAHTPHPDIAENLFKIWGGNEKALAKMITLTEKSGNKPRALSIVANMAVNLKLWGEAKRLLNEIPHEERDVNAWQCLDTLAKNMPKSKKGTKAKDVPSLYQASQVSFRPASWYCSSCYETHSEWMPHCPSCDSFSSIYWRY